MSPGPSSGPPEILIITDRTATAGRPLVEVIERALAALPKTARARRNLPRVAVQLRDKDLPGAPLFDLAVKLRAVTRKLGVELWVNDRVDVAAAAGADGVHLGAGALGVDDVRAVAGTLAIGVSTHDADEVSAAAAKGARFVVFGPVFDTMSKPGASPRGLDGLAGVVALGVPVLALGGVDAGNARACLGAGAAGVACIRAVLAAPDPAVALSGLVACFGRVSVRA